MKIKQLINYLESVAPVALQENYDNSGLLVGDASNVLEGAIICLDVTEKVLNEAISKGCNLVIAHHPLVFSGIKKVSLNNYTGRLLVKAIKNDIAIYAIHTNLDKVWGGVNSRICERLGLENLDILNPEKGQLRKLVTFCPLEGEKGESWPEIIRGAMFEAGAGHIGNYDQCSYNLRGTGTFRPSADTHPYSGEAGKIQFEDEIRIEVIYPHYREQQVLKALFSAHPYEEVAHDIYKLENSWQETGAGMVGDLPREMPYMEFLKMLKEKMNTGCIRYTSPVRENVQRVAVCGGSGSFLLKDAIGAKADVFVSADFKYHQFFDADASIMIADIGHYESEQFTIDLIYELLSKKFNNFAVCKTSVNSNPINYL